MGNKEGFVIDGGPKLPPAAWALLAAGVGTGVAATTLYLPHGGYYGLIPASIILAFWALWSVPARVAFGGLAACYVLVPADYLHLGVVIHVLSIPLIGLSGLAILNLPTHAAAPVSRDRFVYLAFVAYVVLVGVLRNPTHAQATMLWGLSLALALLLIPKVLGQTLTVMEILSPITVLTFALLLYALLEYVLRANPLSGLYNSATPPLEQSWDSYRVMTTLGHPLVNSTVFAWLGTLQYGRFITRSRALNLILALSCVGAVFLTGSRSGLIAIAAGVAALSLVALLRGGAAVRQRVIWPLAALAASLGAAAASGLLDRFNSAEANSSADVRAAALRAIPTVLRETHFLGGGPGSSGELFATYGGPAGAFPLENSLLQALLSYGIPGCALLVVAVGMTLVRSIRHGALLGPATLVAYITAASGFNLLEAYPDALLLPAMSLTLTIAETVSRRTEVGGLEVVSGASRYTVPES